MARRRRRRRNRDVEQLFGNPETLLGFMRRTRKPVFHNSNIFFRDIQFAIRDYFDTVEARPITLPVAEAMARDVIQLYTDVGLLRKVDQNAYRLEAPEFSTPKGGTYSMLTIHGAPLPESVEGWLEMATVGTPVDRTLRDEVKQYKGGEVSPEGATLAALTLPTEPASLDPVPPPENAHPYELVGTEQGPQPQLQSLEEEPQQVAEDNAPDEESFEQRDNRSADEVDEKGEERQGGVKGSDDPDAPKPTKRPPWMKS